MPYMAQTDEVIACLKTHPEVVIISQSNHPNRIGEHRALVHQLMSEGLKNPVIFFQHYQEEDAEDLQKALSVFSKSILMLKKYGYVIWIKPELNSIPMILGFQLSIALKQH